MRSQGERTVQGRSHGSKLPELLIAERDLLKHEKVARIQRESSLQTARGFIPEALASVDIAGQLEDLRVIRQGALGDGEFRARLFVVEITAVKKISPSEMSLPCLGTQANESLERALRQSQTGGCVIEAEEIDVIVSGG